MPDPEGEMLVPINVVAYSARNAGNTGNDVTISWRPIMMAVSYRVWRDDWPIATVAAPTTQYVDSNYVRNGEGACYKVSAIDDMGMESMLSTQAFQAGPFFNRTSPPWVGWSFVPAGTPQNLYLFQQHQMRSDGSVGPRVQMYWSGPATCTWFRIYKNGVLLKDYVQTRIWVDEDVSVGQTYTYEIESVGLNWSYGTGGIPVTGSRTVAKQITVQSAQAQFPLPIQITGFTPRHDSCLVHFEHQAGICCYRLHRVASMAAMKYSTDFNVRGDNNTPVNHIPPDRDARSIEANGLSRDPGGDRLYVLEGLDAPGPFTRMDGEMIMDTDVAEVGTMMPMMPVMHINGQGDSSNRPNVIASSDPFLVPFGNFALSGAQARFENFETWPMPTQINITQQQAEAWGQVGAPTYDSYNLRAFRNENSEVRFYMADMNRTTNFHNNKHPMESINDGGVSGRQSPLHNNQSMWVMSLLTSGQLARVSITGTEVVHAVMFVDDPNTPRDWLGLWFVPSDTELKRPDNVFFEQDDNHGKFTFSTRGARFIIFHDKIVPTVYPGDGSTINGTYQLGYRARWWEPYERHPGAEALDRKIRIDGFFGRNRMKYYENGVLLADMSWSPTRWDAVGEFIVWFVHYFYHSSLGLTEQRNDNNLKHHYLINHRPFSRMRHWDSFGIERLPDFPASVPST